MNSYVVGNAAKLSVTVKDSTGALVDPATLTLTVTRPTNVVDTYTLAAGQIIRDSLGNYHYNYTVTLPGFYTYEFTSTSPSSASSPGEFQGLSNTYLQAGSPTLAQLIAQVDDELHSNTSDLEQRTTLTQNIGTTDTQFTVTDASQITQGVIQIDQETLWVKSIDRTNNIVYIDNATWARGFRNSTVASHSTGAAVINNPRFPDSAIIRALQQTLKSVYPGLFQVKVDESQTALPARLSYQAPADCDVVKDVAWRTIGPSELWKPVQRWRFRPQADYTDFPTGKAIDIGDPIIPGRIIKITYVARPNDLVNLTDTVASTGLPDSVADLLVYGACYRLLSGVEAARLQTWSVAQAARDGLVPAGAAANASKYYFALYNQRLHDEELKLQKLYPVTLHKTR